MIIFSYPVIHASDVAMKYDLGILLHQNLGTWYCLCWVWACSRSWVGDCLLGSKLYNTLPRYFSCCTCPLSRILFFVTLTILLLWGNWQDVKMFISKRDFARNVKVIWSCTLILAKETVCYQAEWFIRTWWPGFDSWQKQIFSCHPLHADLLRQEVEFLSWR
jgi:hypothetical protein